MKLSLSPGVWGALPDHSRWPCRGSSIHGALAQEAACAPEAEKCSQLMPPCAAPSPRVLLSGRARLILWKHNAARGPASVSWLPTVQGLSPGCSQPCREKKERLLSAFCFKVPSPNPTHHGTVQLFNQYVLISAMFVFAPLPASMLCSSREQGLQS